MGKKFTVGDLWQDRIARVYRVVKVRVSKVDAEHIKTGKVYQFNDMGRFRYDDGPDRRDLVEFIMHIPVVNIRDDRKSDESAANRSDMIRLVDQVNDRKAYPMARGLLDYFPDALAAVSNSSYVGNKQHFKDRPIEWVRGTSGDHADALMRHLCQRGTLDKDGVPHSAKVAWRALAMLQEELEAGPMVSFTDKIDR